MLITTHNITIPGGEGGVFVGSRDYSSSRVSGRDRGDTPGQGGQTPVAPVRASDIKSSVLTCNFSDKDKGFRDSTSQLPSPEKMKTNDLKPSLSFLNENDLSDLPFSMPKLQRKMKESGGGGLGLPLAPRSVLPPPQPPEVRPPQLNRPSLDLRLGPRQSRPVSLHASTPSQAAISQLKLPLRGNHIISIRKHLYFSFLLCKWRIVNCDFIFDLKVI